MSERCVHIVAESAEQLIAEAQQVTGINLETEGLHEPLSVLLESWNQESRLRKDACTVMRNYILRLLCNHLRMERDYREHPEIDQEVIRQPIFIWGMPRTGSTKAQKLLAASKDFNYLNFWQSHNPSLFSGDRAENPQIRIAEAEQFCGWFKSASPDTAHTHPLSPFEPEEESFALLQSFMTPCYMVFSEVSGYLQWLASRDLSAQFSYLKRILKYLQWQGLADSAKPWVLKSPLYYGLEPLVFEAFPDAKLVMTHRSPIETIPSFCSTIESYYRAFSDARPDYNVKVMQLAMGLKAHLQWRKAGGSDSLLDIPYERLVGSVDQAVEAIYRHAGLELSDSARAKIHAWDAANVLVGKPAHHYQLSDYGLSEALIESEFAEYSELLVAVSEE